MSELARATSESDVLLESLRKMGVSSSPSLSSSDSEGLLPFLHRVAEGSSLSQDETRAAFTRIMAGDADPNQIASFLTALRMRGETIDEIVGAAQAMRDRMIPVRLESSMVSSTWDVVGTGGDGKGTFNISTCAALLAAACGRKVAKHGNRAVSSRSGAADVLEALGVRIGLPPEGVARCVEKAGIGFMFAQTHHPAMRHVAPIRSSLRMRTIFNVLGPLCNPAEARKYVLGVYDESLLEPLTRSLIRLGADVVVAVHGEGGYDEMTSVVDTRMVFADKRRIVSSVRTGPERFGLPRGRPEDLRGGDASDNAKAIEEVLSGKRGEGDAFRDSAFMSASPAALPMTPKDVSEAVSSGAALKTLETLRRVSGEEAENAERKGTSEI